VLVLTSECGICFSVNKKVL